MQILPERERKRSSVSRLLLTFVFYFYFILICCFIVFGSKDQQTVARGTGGSRGRWEGTGINRTLFVYTLLSSPIKGMCVCVF